VIVLENVEEFRSWGPLLESGRPDPSRRGETYEQWFAQLRGCGYEVETRVLRACDFGAPTTRRRLFLIARCDGRSIVWPKPTHGPDRLLPYRTAAECIDWSIPCPSIFERKRPLAENTMRRIARGIRRYVLDAAEPFLIPVTHPRDQRVYGIHEPMRTITGANRCEIALVAPSLIQTSHGERLGQATRTVVAGGVKHALISAFMVKFYGTSTGADVRSPMPTITAHGWHLAKVCAFLVKYYGQGQANEIDEPLGTVTTRDRFGLVTVAGEEYQIADISMRMLSPRELFLAQGFPASYRIDDFDVGGKPLTKSAQVRMAGNSVCPPLAAAIVTANMSAARRLRAVAA
jgi:DNA (cytosine-5)-methyltransferase 1